MPLIDVLHNEANAIIVKRKGAKKGGKGMGLCVLALN